MYAPVTTPPRVHVSKPEVALRLGRMTALIELRLPAGVASLPEDERRRIVEKQAHLAVESVLDELRGR